MPREKGRESDIEFIKLFSSFFMQEIHTNILQQTCVSDAKTFIKEYDTILTEHNKHHGFYQNKDA